MAFRWREATRRAFAEALSANYLVEELYRLRRRNSRQLGIYLLGPNKKIDGFTG